MNQILKMYYGIDIPHQEEGYFTYKNQLYYFCYIPNIKNFLNIYHFYLYCMKQCQCTAYQIIKNNNQDLFSHQHVLLRYQSDSFHFSHYLQVFLQPYPYQSIKIKNIKESWINKIDQAREKVKEYAYSFKHDQDMISLIYYYCGLGENSISILNEILNINKEASVPLSLSLTKPIHNHIYEILNPAIYTLSSRCRQLVYLWRSRLINIEQIKEMIESHYFDVYELIYLYARILYPSSFFDSLLKNEIQQKDIQEYFLYLSYERECYQQLYYILSYYVSLPKIDWINQENMI